MDGDPIVCGLFVGTATATATATAMAEADPYGMTNKRTGNNQRIDNGKERTDNNQNRQQPKE